MNYQKHYDNLISRAKSRYLEGYKESHHIIPRCLDGVDDKNNLVDLSAREHFIAHLLLIKINPHHYGLIKAVNIMCVQSVNMCEYRSRNRMYSWLKERFSKAQSISQTGKGNSQFGTMWIHNLDLKESKKILKGNDIPIDWSKGRRINWKNAKTLGICKVCQIQVLSTRIICDECKSTQKKEEHIQYIERNKEIIEQKFNDKKELWIHIFEDYKKHGFKYVVRTHGYKKQKVLYILN